MTGIDVRPLTTADWEPFVALRAEGLRRHPEAFATTAEAWSQAPREQTEAALRDSEGRSDNVVFGAFAPELVGLVGLKRESRASVAHKATLWGLFVRPSSRGQGIGGALLQRVLDHARGCAGLDYVRAVVTTENDEAMRLLLAHGFARYGLEVGGIRTREGRFDQAFLRADLTHSA